MAQNTKPNMVPIRKLSKLPAMIWRRMLKTICTPKMISTIRMITPMFSTNLFQP